MQTSSELSADNTGAKKFFFDNPARAALRREIMAAIIDGVPFMILTGPGGGGKTTLISRLAATLPSMIKDVFISQATDGARRFEDVLLRVCRRIDPDTSWDSHPNAKEAQRIQEEIRNYLTEKDIRILLILDQAEQAFLAMLERVRKMLDTVNDGAVRMQLLLVGQERLLTNIEPLRLVQFEEIPERYFTLPLLSEDDLPDFLRQWRQSVASDIPEEALSQRLWRELCTEAAGKPGVLSALLTERIDKLASSKASGGKGGKVTGKSVASDRTKRQSQSKQTTKPSTLVLRNTWQAVRQTLSSLSPTTLLRRLAGALPAPPHLPKFRWPRPAPLAAEHKLIARDLARRRRAAFRRRFRARLRRKNALFWGKLNREVRRLGRGIASIFSSLGQICSRTVVAIFAAIFATMGAIFRAIVSLPWGKTWQIPAHLLTILGTAIISASAATARGCGRLARALTPAPPRTRASLQTTNPETASRARLPKPRKMPALPAGLVKKMAVAVAVFYLLAGGAAVLWHGVFRPSPDMVKRHKPPVVNGTESPSNENAGGKTTASPEEGASNQTERGNTANNGPIPSTVTEIPKSAASPEPIPAHQPPAKTTRTEPTQPDVVKITADKAKKEIEEKLEVKKPAPPRPIHIARTVVMEKAKPQPVAVAKPEASKTGKAGKATTPEKNVTAKTPAGGKTKPAVSPAQPTAKASKNETLANHKTPAPKIEPPVKKEEAVKKEEEEERGGAYDAGLSAGKRWGKGKNSGQYTVQVLTTTQKEAQALVATLPAREASRVSIVPAGAGHVTIFYGDYPSMTEARQARGALPAALRQGNNPYAISVDSAMGRLKAR